MGIKRKRNRSFWGIEITKSNPVTHRFDKARGKLRVTQASFRATSEYRCCSVLCSVGNKTPMALCILNGETNKSCPLDIELGEEDMEVLFSVDHNDEYGMQEMRVHLTGYYFEEYCDCGSSDTKA
ncbi:hypothetical protein MKW92_052689 [Papaver armeniacum]|nr:hypothetical protein MKW92_052689 [Papaver armeniacum]